MSSPALLSLITKCVLESRGEREGDKRHSRKMGDIGRRREHLGAFGCKQEARGTRTAICKCTRAISQAATCSQNVFRSRRDNQSVGTLALSAFNSYDSEGPQDLPIKWCIRH